MTLDDIQAMSDEDLIDLLAQTVVIGMRVVTIKYPPNLQLKLIQEERRIKRLAKEYLKTHALSQT